MPPFRPQPTPGASRYAHARAARVRRALLVGLVVACGVAPLAGPAAAQGPRAWVAPSSDSLAAWAAEARARFKANAGDSVGGDNYRAYELVGTMSRRLLRALGPLRLASAPGVKAVFDSLGLDTDIISDPLQPAFALVMVRNPYRFSANSVGYLCWWYRGEDLRMQGVVFQGGKDPVARPWWTGRPDRPYEWAVVDHERGNGPAHFTLFQLNPSGTQWSVAQSDVDGSVLGESGEAALVDLDHDGVPELVQWTIPRTDSLFEPCSDCPRIMVEKTYVAREEGFGLFDTRVLPSPYATLVTFVRFLLDNHRAEAARLVADPAVVTRALAAGWGVSRKPGTWRIEYGEQGERWPRWLEARFSGPQGVKRYVIHFGQREGHWIIEQFLEPKPVQRNPAAPGGAPPAPHKPRADSR